MRAADHKELALRLHILEERVAVPPAASADEETALEIAALKESLKRLYHSTMYMSQIEWPADGPENVPIILDGGIGGSLFQVTLGFAMGWGDVPHHAHISRMAAAGTSFYQQTYNFQDARWPYLGTISFADAVFGGYDSGWLEEMHLLHGFNKSLIETIYGTHTEMLRVIDASGSVVEYFDDTINDLIDAFDDTIDDLQTQINDLSYRLALIGG